MYIPPERAVSADLHAEVQADSAILAIFTVQAAMKMHFCRQIGNSGSFGANNMHFCT
jgi:hypothetical protein